MTLSDKIRGSAHRAAPASTTAGCQLVSTSHLGQTTILPAMSMTVDSLRTELGKRKLSTEGSKDALQDRLHASDEQELKRVKTVMNSVADEYLCPITQELPIEPVMAEDGKFYERWAIEEWLGKQQRSPSTGVAMGRRLTPVTQVRNTISQLVESGAIDGDKAIACATTPVSYTHLTLPTTPYV